LDDKVGRESWAWREEELEPQVDTTFFTILSSVSIVHPIISFRWFLLRPTVVEYYKTQSVLLSFSQSIVVLSILLFYFIQQTKPTGVIELNKVSNVTYSTQNTVSNILCLPSATMVMELVKIERQTGDAILERYLIEEMVNDFFFLGDSSPNLLYLWRRKFSNHSLV
jgi:hypothetical protein